MEKPKSHYRSGVDHHEICEICGNDTWAKGMWFYIHEITQAWCGKCEATFDGENWIKQVRE